MTDVRPVFEWLVDGAPGARSPMEVVAGMGLALRAGGVPVDRVVAFVSTLHPTVMARIFIWSGGPLAEVHELQHARLQAEEFQRGVLARTAASRQEVRGADGGGDLMPEGGTDMICLPIVFLSGEGHAISFATAAPGGFSDAHIAGLRHAVRPLARVAEILALRRTAANLLSTYVGRDSGDRILSGRITKGDIENIRAVIWFSDLRGFTSLSVGAAPATVVAMLNAVFECQVPPIERHGGEVLKFMGDGMLAIFSIAHPEETARLCDGACDAAAEAQHALHAHNLRHGTSLRFGLALHIGEFAHGNIGGANRLDFTAIGQAVNLASRLEGLTARLGETVVVSAEFAAFTSRPLRDLGEFELKGVPTAQRVFAPRTDVT